MGHIRFLVFYLLSGIAANVVNFLVNIHSAIPELGASGAIAGVMGAYVVMFPRARILTLIPIFFFPFFLAIIRCSFYWMLLQSSSVILPSSGTLSFA